MAAGAEHRSWVLRGCFPSIAAGVLALAPVTPSHAVVVEGRNMIQPRPGDGWVGTWNGSSAVPVAQHWVLSARHVGGVSGQMFVMRGQQYEAVEIRLHESQDLQLIRVANPLPGWHEIGQQPVIGTPVLLGGYGATTQHPLPGGIGWDWSGQHIEAWGRNRIETSGPTLRIRFDAPGGQGAVPQEAAFAINDSGAGLFTTAAGGQLELVGTAVSVSAPGSSAYGISCYCVCIPMFREWISDIVDATVPPPITCDVLAFFSLWFDHDPTADIDGNQSVDVADVFAYLVQWSEGC